mgnify:CR=1 FL=1
MANDDFKFPDEMENEVPEVEASAEDVPVPKEMLPHVPVVVGFAVM